MIRNPLTLISFVILGIFVLIALFQPWLMPFPPNGVKIELTNARPFTTEYLLGGDQSGRDILSRLVESTRSAFIAAAVVAASAVLVGVPAGLIAGYSQRYDSPLSLMFSVIMAIPDIILLIVLYTVLGATTTVAMAVLGILLSPTLFWLVRTLTRGVRNELYVDAARVAGLPAIRIVGRHILSAVRAPVILMAARIAGIGIASQAGLEFLGLGDPSRASWGRMLAEGFNNLYIAPDQLIWPALALGLVTGSFTLLSIGLRDTLEGTPVGQTRRQRQRGLAALPKLATTDESDAVAGGRLAFSASPVPETPAQIESAPLLVIHDLHVAYASEGRLTEVVDGASLRVGIGEIVGIVGESGSGKTQTIFAALGLLPDEAIVTRGSIRLEGKELLGLHEHEMTRIRGRKIGYVPQEPMSNLDPTFTIGAQLVFGIRAQSRCSKKDARELALQTLDRVGLRDPTRVFASYPHQISGGMAQRVLIAGAVACGPGLLVADEPTTALDVTIQAEVLDLIRDLQSEKGMGVLIVTHNFGVVADLCDRVVVMRSGRMLEEGFVESVFREPQHPYTQRLLDAVLDNAPARSQRAVGGTLDA